MMNKKTIIKIFALIVISIIILLSITLFSKDKYIFILNGTEMEDVVGCENAWHYENISVVPCSFNGSVGVLQKEILWWDVSPQDNCARFNGTFIGFNIQNESRAKMLYDMVLPKCWTLVANNLPEGWIEKNCFCIKKCGEETNLCVFNATINESTENFECSEYKCGIDLYLKNE